MFEMGHTEGRQARSYERYCANGAVYMETTIRNQNWDVYLQNYGGDGGLLPSQCTQHHVFHLLWQNQYQLGVGETMQIQNALGLYQEITLKKLPKRDEIWTTTNMFWTAYYDQSIAVPGNRSLIRSAPNYILNPPSIDNEAGQGLNDAVTGLYVNQAGVFRTFIGPFLSIDTFYIHVPLELLALFDIFQTALFAAMHQNVALLDRIVPVRINPMPPTWLQFVWWGVTPFAFSSPRHHFPNNCLTITTHVTRNCPSLSG
ncbi:Aste57867_13043 [Aphanomyces stellatus]|uniref:Aste57867_13043 protein n=1 Tax=Aphanomyces stellatus TaxID=120398 RepID=A0A485KX65_9STRA|nr:hypothetical protein As57867_012995 [Aphanomyces stellatus]VFT89888.1 Aste57867_13043 [Aphanomyces stellatus]